MREWIVRVLESIIGETTSVMPERAVIAVGFMILVGLVIFYVRNIYRRNRYKRSI